jgi:hypothetical protein
MDDNGSGGGGLRRRNAVCNENGGCFTNMAGAVLLPFNLFAVSFVVFDSNSKKDSIDVSGNDGGNNCGRALLRVAATALGDSWDFVSKYADKHALRSSNKHSYRLLA